MTDYNAKGKVVTMGEVCVMVSSSEQSEVKQPGVLHFSFKGYEMNVAFSLSSLGQEVSHFTVVSDNLFGDAILENFRRKGIGTYYVHKAAIPANMIVTGCDVMLKPSLPANVQYMAPSDKVKLNQALCNEILMDAGWLFWSSGLLKYHNSAARLSGMFKKAWSNKINIFTDLSFLNQGAEDFSPVMVALLLPYTSIVVASVENINLLLGTDFSIDTAGFMGACTMLTTLYPNINGVFDKVCNGSICYGRGWVNERYLQTPEIEIGNIIDSAGTSESFAAGLLFILRFHEEQHALNFAIAAYALQHKKAGDYNVASVNEIIEIFQSSKQ